MRYNFVNDKWEPSVSGVQSTMNKNRQIYQDNQTKICPRCRGTGDDADVVFAEAERRTWEQCRRHPCGQCKGTGKLQAQQD
jgi:RecJ-like exonuclease